MKTLPIILAAGQGKRMKSSLPKPLKPLLGKTILDWILDSLAKVDGLMDPLIVVGHGKEIIRERLSDRKVSFVDQDEQLGTGHAIMQCLPEIEKQQAERIVVLYGDVPMISSEAITALVNAKGPAMLAFHASQPQGYGRVTIDEQGHLINIIEEKDASDEEKENNFVNSGFCTLEVNGLKEKLNKLKNDNAQKEYYLTDLLVHSSKESVVEVLEIEDEIEAAGINTPHQFLELVRDAKYLILLQHVDNGVDIVDFETVYIEADVEIAAGVKILPFTVIKRGVKIKSQCEVGPFSHLREGTVMEEGAEVGNFTEVKMSHIGEDSKAKHLSYIGDALIGKGVNIGAGTIFANYDGQKKHKTQVADGCFVGSGTVLVAPVDLGKDSKTGAGAVVTAKHHVEEGDTVVGVPARPLNKRREEK